MKLPKHKKLTPLQKKIYAVLCTAKQRCTNPNHAMWYRYGARGIKYLLDGNKSRIQIVLEQEAAYRAAMKKYPDEKISINRKDGDGDYVEENIEWTSNEKNIKQMHKDNPNACKKMQHARKKPVEDEKGNWFESAAEAARQNNIQRSDISSCCSGGKKKTAGGKRWKFSKIKK